MSNIQILDVTLRDGGCVNDFNFGIKYMQKILLALENSKIDIIELGYLDNTNGSIADRTKYVNEKVIYENFVTDKKNKISYVAMMDYGKFDVDRLEICNQNGIDGIRLAFHKKDMLNIVPIAKKIMTKGYNLYIQPMITMRYTDVELLQLIEIVNKELYNAKAFYIVDSFGEMKSHDVTRIMNLVDHNLVNTIAIGFHSHNNMQMSYSNAMTLLGYDTERNLIIDSSIMGMGKGAGNLNTELLIEELNAKHNGKYDNNSLLEVIDTVVEPLHSEFDWGYSVEYYLSAINGCTPSYAGYFYNKHSMAIDQLNELLGMIDEHKKISFDKLYAEEIYKKYNAQNQIDDSEVLKEIKRACLKKEVLIVAPGKSLIQEKKNIIDKLENSNVISFGLNITDDFNFDYIVITRKELLEKALMQETKIIIPSNLAKYTKNKKAIVIDYKKWIDENEQVHDSSSVILLNILAHIGINKIALAGFDGFSQITSSNYYDYSLRNHLDEQQVNSRNKYYKDFLGRLKKSGVDIEFLTATMYC